MELSYVSLISALVVLVSLFLHVLFFKNKSSLPPGKYGWPILGESLDFLNAGRVGQPEKFIWDRIAKYSTSVFRTHLLGERMAVFCGAASNKFLYSNENKLVQVWWPSSYRKVFPTSVSQGTSEEESVKLKNMLPNFLKPEALHRYVSIMDDIAQRHFAEGWDGKEEVSVYPQAKEYTFWLVCRIFLRMEDDSHIKRFSVPFFSLAAGLAAVPIDLPGTPFRKSIRTADLIRKDLVAIMKQRKVELAEGKASPTQDLLSYMMLHKDEDGKSMLELDIADKILGFIIAGHDSASSACAFVIKYLAELPEVYQGVYKEQMEIANSKKPGEGLNMEDIQKMKYSGNVISEVLRLAPPLQGAFREALTDFMYSGFSIPKGWKIYWSTHSTHRNPECFPNPTKFDPSRFEEKPAPFTYVPFGGGPRMCPGREYARMEILIFMHHLVKRFRVVKMIPDEKIVVDPLPVPAKGLPVRLYPHKA